jgi:hypothetical protein
LASSAPLFVKAQNAPGVRGGGAAQEATMPQRTARAFAPFIRAILQRRSTAANGIFKLRRGVQTNLESPETARILSRFRKLDDLALSLIGGKMLGQDVGVLLFTVVSEDGPVAFKVYYYGFGQDMNIARLEITDDWEELERGALTVDMLPSPITVSLGGMMIDAGGGQ